MNIANVKCTPVRFQPGDRIIVRCNGVLSPQQRAQLKATVERWAGGNVPVIIVELPLLELEIERV